MTSGLRASAAALACLIACAGAPNAAGSRVETIEHGVFETGGVRRVALPRSVSGEMNLVAHVRLLRTAEVVAAQPGRSFGWRYRFHGLPAGAVVTLRTRHPPLTNPRTGKTMQFSERRVTVANPDEVRYTGYTFDYTWEMAEGVWSFQILYRGRLIGERRFRILVPLN